MPTVSEGVHVLPLEVEDDGDVRRFHPTAVATDRGVLLLDVGFSHTVDQLADGLAEAGYDLADVETVLMTHHDSDHADGLAEVFDRADPAVFAHRDEVPYLDGRSFPVKTPDDQDRYEPVPVDLELVGGEVVRTAAGPMELLHTPGHSPGHLAAYLPERSTLLAADAMTARGGLGGFNPEYTPDEETATESIGRLANLDVERVVCYHGGTVEATRDDVAGVYEALRG